MSNQGGTEEQYVDQLRNLTLNPAPMNNTATVTASTMSNPATQMNAASAVERNNNINTNGEQLPSSTTDIPLQDRRELRSDTINYDAQRMIGHGSFGAVFLAKVTETDEIVAIKKVLQDKRFKNRELQIMRQLSRQPHPYVVTLKHHFVSKGTKPDEVYLNLVLEYIPETVYSISKYFNRRKESIPMFSVKLYMYQLARALAHIHGMGICHRDIKPHNLLVDPVRHVLKLCDFGSAKTFVKGEPNVAYICSRFYRAPELIFGSTDYTTAIDVWSQGCVFAELLIGSPIFPGSSGVDQLVEIIKILGTPTREELKSMNPNYQEFKFPQIRAYPWGSMFKAGTPPDAIDLISKMLAYDPEKRVKAIEACTHRFFDELRQMGTTMPDRSPLAPELFQFTSEELSMAPQLVDTLIPTHIKSATTSTTSADTPPNNNTASTTSTANHRNHASEDVQHHSASSAVTVQSTSDTTNPSSTA